MKSFLITDKRCFKCKHFYYGTRPLHNAMPYIHLRSYKYKLYISFDVSKCDRYMSEVHDVRGFSLAKTSYSLIQWLLFESLDSTLLICYTKWMLVIHSLNWLLFELLHSMLYQKTLECNIITSGYILGDYVTFLRFLKTM